MPAHRMNMRMIKDVLRLKFDGGFSHDRIAASLGISKGVVTKYVGLAGAAGLDWAIACDMDEGELERRLLGKPTGPAAYAQPDYGRIHQELRRKGVTLTLLWEEYQAEFANRKTYRYTQFCEHYKAFAKRLKRSMRQIHRAGEKLFVDFAGPTLPLTTGRRAHIFVAAMGASSYTFACATPAETMEDWLSGIARALTFYGGVPQLIVPDNPRAMIADPDRYEPRAGDTVLDFARHYGTSFLPARVYRPQDKPKVEVAVQVVERWIMARLRHRQFESVQSVDDAIRPLLKNLNERPFQKLPGCRASAFTELDAPALQPLPVQPYELARFKTVTVHIDYHIEIDKHRYSVPHALVGLKLDARITAGAVELLHRGPAMPATIVWEATPPSSSTCRRHTAPISNGLRSGLSTGVSRLAAPPARSSRGFCRNSAIPSTAIGRASACSHSHVVMVATASKRRVRWRSNWVCIVTATCATSSSTTATARQRPRLSNGSVRVTRMYAAPATTNKENPP
jgi:transposase